MSGGIDRTEILRKDCPVCNGNGYRTVQENEQVCDNCDGSGQIEKEVAFKFDGDRSKEELDSIWNNQE
jgi:RecJ-like exonuclease